MSQFLCAKCNEIFIAHSLDDVHRGENDSIECGGCAPKRELDIDAIIEMLEAERNTISRVGLVYECFKSSEPMSLEAFVDQYTEKLMDKIVEGVRERGVRQ